MNVLGFCLVLREYPKGLGKALVKMYRELNIPEAPLACLRQKADIAYTSDLQLFNSLPMGDTWPDASLKDVYLYLWKFNKGEGAQGVGVNPRPIHQGASGRNLAFVSPGALGHVEPIDWQCNSTQGT